VSPELDHFVLDALFSTLTNVNFDEARFVDYVKHASTLTATARALYESACAAKGVTPHALGNATRLTLPSFDTAALQAAGRSVGIEARKATFAGNEDAFGLLEMTMYGLKGMCAYVRGRGARASASASASASEASRALTVSSRPITVASLAPSRATCTHSCTRRSRNSRAPRASSRCQTCSRSHSRSEP
jgi:hydroxylamine reductase